MGCKDSNTGANRDSFLPPSSNAVLRNLFIAADRSTLLVGAPKAQTDQPGVEQGGAVYRCSIDSPNMCQMIPFDTSGPGQINLRGQKENMDDKSHQWFGATVHSSGENGAIVKNVKSGKGPLTTAGLLKLVKRFEQTGKLEDRERAGRPCLKENVHPALLSKWKRLRPKQLQGTSSAREAARQLGLPPSSVRNILHRIIQLYPYKLQSCHVLLPADTTQRRHLQKWAFSKMEQDPTWAFNILWTGEAHFSLHGDVNNHNCRICETSNPREYTRTLLL
ncbi:uncharacterized protein TNCV_2040451 [Trichonephila clavipes]|nr:uncharacterized protein TNCV_2040451 [Trichonephila clavipes]